MKGFFVTTAGLILLSGSAQATQGDYCEGPMALVCLSTSSTLVTQKTSDASTRASSKISDASSSKDEEKSDTLVRVNVAALLDQAYLGRGYELSLVAERVGVNAMDLADTIVRICRENPEMTGDTTRFAPFLAAELSIEFGLEK